jgi:RNA polymerase sigma-70 factor (ECF subfamily)
VQEAFLRLHRQATRRGASNIRNMQSWLFRVAHNLAMDSIRKRERSKRGKRQAAEAGTLEADPPETVDALGEMIHQEDCQKALSELDRLPQPQRQAIFLRVIQDMTLREVGEVTGLTVGNAAYRIDQGLKTLARRLKSEGVI